VVEEEAVGVVDVPAPALVLVVLVLAPEEVDKRIKYLRVSLMLGALNIITFTNIFVTRRIKALYKVTDTVV
jgi:hypothetical protein